MDPGRRRRRVGIVADQGQFLRPCWNTIPSERRRTIVAVARVELGDWLSGLNAPLVILMAIVLSPFGLAGSAVLDEAAGAWAASLQGPHPITTVTSAKNGALAAEILEPRAITQARGVGVVQSRSLVRHAAFGGALHVLDVLVERAARGLVGRRFPGGSRARPSSSARQLDVERVLVGVDRDPVAVLHQRRSGRLPGPRA